MLFFVAGIILAPLALWLLGVIGQAVHDRLSRPTMAEEAEELPYCLEPSRTQPWATPTGDERPLVLRQAERVADRRWRVWE